MKKLCVISLMLAALGVSAASWQTGDSTAASGQASFTISSIPIAVIGSVRSNTAAIVTPAGVPGAPVIDQIWIKEDLGAGVLDFWVPTNSWTLASNGVAIGSASTNVIWLTSTNAGMATNDVFVYRNRSQNTYQMTVIGGGTTSATGLVATNALGQCAVKLAVTLTNTPAAGDTIYQMASVQQLTPLALGNVTNDVPSPFGSLFMLSTRAAPLKFSGDITGPNLITLTYSNSGSIYVNGSYVRP